MGAAQRAVIVGGSVGGLITAHALIKAGWEVTVLEQSPSISPAGAGIALDEHTADVMKSFGLVDQYEEHSSPLPVEINHAVRDRVLHVLFRDSNFNHRSTHWSLIHQMLLNALPDQGKTTVKFSHHVTNIQQSAGGLVTVTASVSSDCDQTHEVQLQGGLAVAADGSMSRTRAQLIPNEPRRYVGYCAWRGVLQRSENPDVARQLEETYKDLGQALYFDIAHDSHAVLYELPGGRLNWLWYENQPEPELKGPSVTIRAPDEQIADMKRRAQEAWPPALAALMKATAAPFINALFDREPIDTFVYGRIVLLGEAAHPTTPHGLRSTNMAIADAASLGQALQDNPDNVDAALQQYDHDRVPTTRQEVLFSRWLGQLKQGLLHDGDGDAWQHGQELQELLQQIPQTQLRKFNPDEHRFAKTN